MVDTQKFVQTIDELAHTLRELADSGVRGFDCAPEALDTLESWGRHRPPRRPHPQPQHQPQPTESLEMIREDIGDCQRCNLCRSRTRIVFGAGSPRARLMFIGEGPGQDEDRAGEPFVGAAGQLLTRIIAAIKLSREEVYIANVVKCRPPDNRTPAPEEIATCSPFLRRQILSIRPLFICTLGGCAAQTLLGTTEPISRLRGRMYDNEGIRVLPTFHPAYLLRNPEKKRAVWEDMQQLMKELSL
ncbi:MAG TPA: uracil-DNA glycosylase [Desulfobacterales bacterium]|nr:uracil-DNA glycosylase [Desulfobacterales bacterium]